jgi:hypothetical protein
MLANNNTADKVSQGAVAEYVCSRASLAALGVKLQRLGLFLPLEKRVTIHQKVLKYRPTDKLKALVVAILAGMTSLVELNQRLRAEPALQKAFGLRGCAEQSVVQDTLDAVEPLNVEQLDQAVAEIYQHFGAAPHHNYLRRPLVLNLDFTPSPCGKQAEEASRGYFGSTVVMSS